MQEPTSQQTPNETRAPTPMQPKKKSHLNFWLNIVLVVLLVASLAFSAWYWCTAEAKIKNLEDQKIQLQAQLDQLTTEAQEAEVSGADTATPCNDTVSNSLAENIKAALDSQNTAAFSTYTTNPVNYVLAASELGKDMTPDEAAISLDYTHSATGSWDFNLPQATLDMYLAGFYKGYFGAKRYVGKAASGMVVSFGFDCNGKINKIFVAADDDLLL